MLRSRRTTLDAQVSEPRADPRFSHPHPANRQWIGAHSRPPRNGPRPCPAADAVVSFQGERGLKCLPIAAHARPLRLSSPRPGQIQPHNYFSRVSHQTGVGERPSAAGLVTHYNYVLRLVLLPVGGIGCGMGACSSNEDQETGNIFLKDELADYKVSARRSV